jgi:23S rRNA pseudouridine1911/1915/1917 synthase
VSVRILYEDNHLLVLDKPPLLATMGALPEKPSLVQLAKDDLKRRFNKPGNVYLGVVSRLDSMVSGVVVLAKTSKAAGRLTEQFRNREVIKTYWAIVEGLAPPGPVDCLDWLLRDQPHQCVGICTADTPDAQEAQLTFRRLGQSGGLSWLEIDLHTGRKHQIRVQLAGRNLPILGDRKYGARRPFSPGIALHARSLTLAHPVRKEPMTFLAEPPASWRKPGFPTIAEL